MHLENKVCTRVPHLALLSVVYNNMVRALLRSTPPLSETWELEIRMATLDAEQHTTSRHPYIPSELSLQMS